MRGSVKKKRDLTEPTLPDLGAEGDRIKEEGAGDGKIVAGAAGDGEIAAGVGYRKIAAKVKEERAVVEKPVVRHVAGVAAASGARKSILSGNSIGDIINGATGKGVEERTEGGEEGEQDVPKDSSVAAERTVDTRSEEKINAARGQFLGEIYRHRPRIAMALEEMRVTGNEIRVGVPTQQLYEEIMRNRSEIIDTLRITARITGRVDLVVEIVDDNDQTRKPIKAEDKLKFLTERNPALTDFRKSLGLELE